MPACPDHGGHPSLRFWGESILPLHYFRQLRRKGVECWFLVHERCRAELQLAMSELTEYVAYVPETWMTRRLHRIGRRLPSHVRGVMSTRSAS
jgi:hypothetical protein